MLKKTYKSHKIFYGKHVRQEAGDLTLFTPHI